MIKTLLWKDYRQNLRLLVAIAIFLAIPYVVMVVAAAAVRLRDSGLGGSTDDLHVPWNMMLMQASLCSIVMLVVASAFIAGNAFAGERADRSAEFTAYLPIPRGSTVVSKALVAIGACMLFLLVDTCIAFITHGLGGLIWHDNTADPIIGFAVTAVLIFGVAWLFSAISSSPGMAAASGLMSVILVGGSLTLIDFTRSGPEIMLQRWYAPLCLLFGLGGFICGVLYYLRRGDI